MSFGFTLTMLPIEDIVHFLLWYFISLVIGWIGLPLTWRFFSHLPGRGVAWARLAGLLVTAYLFWLLGSLGILRNVSISGVFAAILVVIAGIILLRRKGLAELAGWLKQEWRAALASELVFLAGFAGWALVRAYNPDILGTEKPMEFMFLNSILKSSALPPRDAWLSGHAISYYYLGYFLSIMLTRLANTPSAIAFNLSLALWFGLAASGAFGILLELIALSEKRLAQAKRPGHPIMPNVLIPALIAPVFLLLLGNLYGAFGLVHRNGWLANTRLPALIYDFGELTNEGGLVEAPGLRAGWVNLWEWLDLKRLETPPAQNPGPLRWDLDNWFFAARVVHDRDLVGREQEAIDENPAFSFLLGDLHPHLLGLPFVLLVVGLALQWLEAGTQGSYSWNKFLAEERADVQAELRPSPGGGSCYQGWTVPGTPAWIFSAVVLGSLIALNTWDFPIYAVLILLAMVCGQGYHVGWQGLLNRLPILFLRWIGLVALSCLAYLPFFLTFQSQAGGVLPNVFYPTRFQQFLVFFLPVLASCLLFLAWLWVQGRSQRMLDRRWAWFSGAGVLLLLVLAATLLGWIALQLDSVRAYVDQALQPLPLEQVLSLTLQRRLVDGLTVLLLAWMIGASIGLVVGILKSAKRDVSLVAQPAVLFILLLLLVGALLVLVPEFLYLRDNFVIRMNTLFKFYFQSWVLWSQAGAFGLWWVFRFGRTRLRLAAMVFAGVPILLGLVFLPASLASKTAGWSNSPTLDGMRYFAQQYPQDWAAIQWLQDNAPGDAVILEGSRGAYWLEGRSGRISMATGLSAVLGWANHERQWRGDYYDRVAKREDLIRLIYRGRDWESVRHWMDEFQVEYVLVSDLERDWYQPVQEAKFQQHMREVFRSGNLVIYQRR
jgi:YYY domain-containing protein